MTKKKAQCKTNFVEYPLGSQIFYQVPVPIYKRGEVEQACARCRRLKIKCTKSWPCNRCFSRKEPNSCADCHPHLFPVHSRERTFITDHSGAGASNMHLTQSDLRVKQENNKLHGTELDFADTNCHTEIRNEGKPISDTFPATQGNQQSESAPCKHGESSDFLVSIVHNPHDCFSPFIPDSDCVGVNVVQHQLQACAYGARDQDAVDVVSGCSSMRKPYGRTVLHGVEPSDAELKAEWVAKVMGETD